MLALRLDGAPIAMKFNVEAGDGAFALKVAFDEAYARFSPGVALEIESIRGSRSIRRPTAVASGGWTPAPSRVTR